MAYLLDANVFIESKNRYYGMDFCPAFWDWLEIKHREEIVYSIQSVKDELEVVEDDLKRWAQAAEDSFFLTVTPEVLAACGQASEWTINQHYEQSAIDTFFESADYYLLAQALSGGHTVVTHEVPADTKKKVKIPNACVGVGVPYINLFTLLRKEGARFVLP